MQVFAFQKAENSKYKLFKKKQKQQVLVFQKEETASISFLKGETASLFRNAGQGKYKL